MADSLAQSESSRCLEELLAKDLVWPLKQRLLFVQQLAVQVQSLHAAGRIHRAISTEAVVVDGQRRPHLGPPAGPRRLGGEASEPEFCPPELAGTDAVELPAEIEAAANVLAPRGHLLDPRRIDVYQLGVLLCRLLTGESVLAYIYSPTVKAQVPTIARPVLARALGVDDSTPLLDCEQLLSALEEAIRQADLVKTPDSLHETPAHGSVLWSEGDTPAKGRPPVGDPSVGPGPVEQLPFKRLGHYQIVERIGQGGMGDVYKGYDESLDRCVAIKVLPADLARDKSFVYRFHAEATAAAKVAHPNVVPVYFSGEDAGHHFFAMQFIEGESLAQRLARKKRLAVDETLLIAQHCLAGLKAAHDQGLIHRDVKPGNVLLDRQANRAVLVDFGLVRTIDGSGQMTATGVVMGTCDYIAPEQARGLKVDGRTDIYSLGVLLYQLLSGRLPFRAETPTAMIFQHAYETPPPLQEVAPDVPPAVAAIIARMMAKKPDARYASCAEVLADIRAFRRGLPLAAAAPVSVEPAVSCDESPPSELPADLLAGVPEYVDQRVWQRARDWAATIFRRHAPQSLQDLQSTTQQVDGAVAEYERRRGRLARLVAEGRDVAAALLQQIETNAQLAAAAEKRAASAGSDEQRQAALAIKQECEQALVAHRRQHVEHQRQIEDFEEQLGKADATLAQLRSQRDLLCARLKAAEARQAMEKDRPRLWKRRWVVLAAILGCMALGGAWLLLPRHVVVPVVVLPNAPVVAPATGDVIYALDDGRRDFNSGSMYANGSFLFANEFTAAPGGEVIKSIRVLYGPGGVAGTPVQLVLFKDRNNAATPSQPVLLASTTSAVTAPGTDTFYETAIPPTRVTGNFFVGVLVGPRPSAGLYPIAMDGTAPQHRSYGAFFRSPVGVDVLARMHYDAKGDTRVNMEADSYNFVPVLGRNYMIRAVGQSTTAVSPRFDNASPETKAPALDLTDPRWTDLLADLDLNRDKLRGKWSRDDNGVAVAPHQRLDVPLEEWWRDGNGVPVTPTAQVQRFTCAMLPHHVEGSYDVLAEFTRTSGNDSVTITLPVGARQCTLHFSARNGYAGGLERINEQIIVSADNPAVRHPSGLINGHRYQTLVQVRTQGDNATIDVWLDGNPFVHWTGRQDQLSTAGAWTLPKPQRVGIGANVSSVTFHTVRLLPVATP